MKRFFIIFFVILPALLLAQIRVGSTPAKTTATSSSFINTSTSGFWHKPLSGCGLVYLGSATTDLTVVGGKNDAFFVKCYDGSWTIPIELDALGLGLHASTGLNLHLAANVEIVDYATIGDSLRLGGGAWLRKIFTTADHDSVGLIYYNPTLVRADTVWMAQ